MTTAEQDGSAVIKLAVMAVGGQGGGVLTNWIESLARSNGYAAQATSVAGVAQRTGATVYYVEMAPKEETEPVFALMPSPGDVDILIAAELMEAGRAVMRGFASPDRTIFVASTHRALAVSEKSAPADGIADSAPVIEAVKAASRRHILLDLEMIAASANAVISASLFGALAAARALPFARRDFEAEIRKSGRAVGPNLDAFAAAFEAVSKPVSQTAPARRPVPALEASGPQRLIERWNALATELDRLPDPVQRTARAGLCKVVDFQDIRYGQEYLERLNRICAVDNARQDWQLTTEAAKYVANAMAYDDMIRVADLKTRRSRFERIDREMNADRRTIVRVTDFMHPRAREVVGLLPAGLGARIDASPVAMRNLDRIVNRSRRMRSDRLLAFLQMHMMAGLRFWRRRTLRHAIEMKGLNSWLDQAIAQASGNYPLAVEIIKLRRLVRGYSDTHCRTSSKFDKARRAAKLVAHRSDAADWLRRLRHAALADPDGDALDGAVKTIESFSRQKLPP